MTYIPREMTSPELEKIRSEDQSSELFLAIFKPATVYTARVNQTFSTLDRVVQITYDAGSGTLANVLPGMTAWIGSTAGSYDLGMCRIRKTPTSTIFYIGETSEITFVDNAYITIVDDAGPWARNIRIGEDYVPFMDYDIPYSDQHSSANPVPCIGPRYIPVWLVGSTVTVSFDGSLSWVIGSSIASYVWTAPGASATSGLTTATPTITYNAVGKYRVQCVVTAANGKSTTAFAWVELFNKTNMPVTQFDLKSCTGSFTDGGWKFEVDMWAQAGLNNVIDRAMVVLFAKNYYGTSESSIGQIAGRENIIASGWIEGDSITWDPDGSMVNFQVTTIHAWMKRLPGFPIGIENATTTPTAWTQWQGLTVDKSLFHLFFWQSTIIPVVDVFLTDDTRTSAEQYAPGDSVIFDQVNYLLKNTILGSVGCDRFGRLFCEVDVQLTPPASRSSVPVILDLQVIDWRDEMRITRVTTNETSQVSLSGVVIDLPNTPYAVFSLAPGHAYGQWGRPVKQDRVLLSSQAQSNQLAAMKLAWDNHNYEFEIDLAVNNMMLDVFPSKQFVGIVVLPDDTPREFLFDGHVVVREINVGWESAAESANFLQISWQAENETFPGNSSDGDTPENTTPNLPPFPPIASFPPIATLPIITPQEDPTRTKTVILNIVGHGIFYTTNFDDQLGAVNWYAMNAGLPDPAALLSFEISASGRCFCQYGFDAVYSAPTLGAAWVLVFDKTMVGNPESYPFPRDPSIAAFGINRDADDELMIVAGVVVTIGSDYVAYPFYGSSGGVTIANSFFINPNTSAVVGYTGGHITFGNGVWVWSYAVNGWIAVTTELNQNGTTVLGTQYRTALNAGQQPISTRSRWASSAVLIVNGGGTLAETLDNGQNWDVMVTNPTPFQDTESYISSADGSDIVICENSVLGFKRSSDYGATWGSGLLAHALTAVWNITGDGYIVAGANTIKFTPDFGNSFFNKTGDLQTWVSAFFTVRQIRAL